MLVGITAEKIDYIQMQYQSFSNRNDIRKILFVGYKSTQNYTKSDTEVNTRPSMFGIKD